MDYDPAPDPERDAIALKQARMTLQRLSRE